MFQDDAIVVDLGSCSIRAGFSGVLLPTCTFPTVISPDNSHRYNMVGIDAITNGQQLRYPIHEGHIQSSDDFRILMDYVFHSLPGVRSENFPVFIADSAAQPIADRGMMAQILFDEFHVPGLMIRAQPLCAIQDSGVSSGLVVDCGNHMTQVTPVFSHIACKSEIVTYRLGGRQLTEYFQDCLSTRNGQVIDFFLAMALKESLCYVSPDFEQEMANEQQVVPFHLIDGSELVVGNERFRCPEALFNPDLIDMTIPGVPEICANVIERCTDVFNGLSVNVTVVGGSTLFEGFMDRFKSELATRTGERPVTVVSDFQRDLAVWTGAAKIARSLRDEWVTSEEYHSRGVQVFKDYFN